MKVWCVCVLGASVRFPLLPEKEKQLRSMRWRREIWSKFIIIVIITSDVFQHKYGERAGLTEI